MQLAGTITSQQLTGDRKTGEVINTLVLDNGSGFTFISTPGQFQLGQVISITLQ
jgi:hypothetical protein